MTLRHHPPPPSYSKLNSLGEQKGFGPIHTNENETLQECCTIPDVIKLPSFHNQRICVWPTAWGNARKKQKQREASRMSRNAEVFRWDHKRTRSAIKFFTHNTAHPPSDIVKVTRLDSLCHVTKINMKATRRVRRNSAVELILPELFLWHPHHDLSKSKKHQPTHTKSNKFFAQEQRKKATNHSFIFRTRYRYHKRTEKEKRHINSKVCSPTNKQNKNKRTGRHIKKKEKH